jgi:uncharacterized alkaline shock family protein YloU
MSFVADGPRGTVTIPDATLSALITRAAELVDGARVRRRRRVEVELANARAHVTIELAARYGTVLPELARAVQQEVRDALETMCGVEVAAVDVAVEEVE